MTDAQPLRYQLNDRVRILSGEHKDRIGSVTIVTTMGFAATAWGVKVDQVMVSLDGEPGQVAIGRNVVARGGRGGVNIVIDVTHIERIV